ncbi:MAG: MlaD family protein, partial [Chlamydiales bacterium]
MISDRYKAFWLGLFVIFAILVVAWLFLFLRPSVGDGKKTLRIRFTNVGGVTVGTRVTFGGRAVGEVTEINEIYDARSEKSDSLGNVYFFELIAKVDSKIKIYNYDEIEYTTQGLLGEKSVAIIP